jgi:hypothetical protein
VALKTMVASLVAARQAYEQQLAALGSGAAEAIAAELGALIPRGCYVGWTQYAPYFNDGEPCTFSVNDAYLARLPEADADGYRAFERHGDEAEDSICLSNDVSRYGLEDEQYDAPCVRGGTHRATRYGIPLVDGVAAEALTALADLWQSLPHDMLRRAFGDDTGVRITREADGSVTHECHDHDHD